MPCRSLKWRVTYRIGVHIIRDSILRRHKKQSYPKSVNKALRNVYTTSTLSGIALTLTQKRYRIELLYTHKSGDFIALSGMGIPGLSPQTSWLMHNVQNFK